jgi:hypothetical protein
MMSTRFNDPFFFFFPVMFLAISEYDIHCNLYKHYVIYESGIARVVCDIGGVLFGDVLWGVYSVHSA